MTTPYLAPSRLQEQAKALGINLETADQPVLANLYLKTLIGIRDEIYNQELEDLAENPDFARVLGRDVREVTNGIYSLAQAGYREIIEVSGPLESARQKLAVAVMLYDSEEVANPIEKINGRVQALSEFGQILHKVILYWPKK